MAIKRIDSINLNEAALVQDGVTGANGGVSTSITNIRTTPQISNNTFSDTFIFNIRSNQTTFTTNVNGEIVADSKSIRITRDSLSNESKRIEVSKSGYINNEYYIIEMVDDGKPIIDNPKLDKPLGISTKDIVITKYDKKTNSVIEASTSIKDSVKIELSFNFVKVKDTSVTNNPIKYKIKFNISGTGTPVSILKNGNTNAEFFPSVGISEYEDVDGTKYVIRSSDSALYRITKIYFNNEELLANVGESLELNVTLKDNYTFIIETEEILQGTPAKDPQIQLVNDGAREYNINSKAGVPLMFRKNADVEAITVIVGDDVLEFDDLDKGDLCGITIPHSVFINIGKYNVKIFPFSFDDYEKQVRAAVPAVRVEPKKVTPITKQKVVKEEVVVETPKVEDIYNPYNASGGGSGLGSKLILTNNDYFQNTSFVDTPNPKVAQK